ncbi:hypothetical protein BOTBODRAFT_268103 [Botryobasidium botryosum FD-172 SS1]|uniref:Uncharacterized protein n=1 Tax=Botryobasidium botryosum (strain FD-172 SS1) TaxID=930990 RepID=A0A067MK01_BOTB1|nr:hypothetical protein BOTBODRAFT_268103 [Botryobasidium botryosum FD-172 SS1]
MVHARPIVRLTKMNLSLWARMRGYWSGGFKTGGFGFYSSSRKVGRASSLFFFFSHCARSPATVNTRLLCWWLDYGLGGWHRDMLLSAQQDHIRGVRVRLRALIAASEPLKVCLESKGG